MSAIKYLLENIYNCEICEGVGYVDGWVSPDGDFDFEWCECNPEHLATERENPYA